MGTFAHLIMTIYPRSCRRSLARTILLILVAGLFLPWAHAAVDLPKRDFAIPAGEAQITLKQFAQQAMEQVVFSPELVRGVPTNAIKGEFTARGALERLLDKTPLAVVEDSGTSALTVRRKPELSSREQTSPAAAVRTTAASPTDRNAAAGPSGDEVVAMSAFEVNYARDHGYQSSQVISGTRTVESLKNTPASISILNRDLMDDLIVADVGELSRYGVTGEQAADPRNPQQYVYRGITAPSQMRNGVVWLFPVDTFSLERVEILGGPNQFLYGESLAGGTMNQVTKVPRNTDFEKASVTGGSYDFWRAEFDVNRRLGQKLSLRLNLAYQDADTYNHYAGRRFRGVALAAAYKPFESTRITVNAEKGDIVEIARFGLRADAFSTTRATGAVTTYAVTTGGETYVPGLQRIINTVSTRRSIGSNVILPDAAYNESLLDRSLNFYGPNAQSERHYQALNVTVEQAVGKNLNLLANLNWAKQERYLFGVGGSTAQSISLDSNPTLAGGVPNPYYNEPYVEYIYRKSRANQLNKEVRLTAVYTLKLPFTTQKLMAFALETQFDPDSSNDSEFVDPSSAAFRGTLNPASTLAAYQANVTTLGQNYFYRRLYLKDGDSSDLTQWKTIPGRSVFGYDPVVSGSAGRLIKRRYFTPAYGFGVAGKYWKDRIDTMVGLRHDEFEQAPQRALYNAVTGQEYQVSTATTGRVDYGKDTVTAGAVVHPTRWVSAFFNYATSVQLSSGFGVGLKAGTPRGFFEGETYDAGVRWTLLGGRLESSWTAYRTKSQNAAAAVPLAVSTELQGVFGDVDTTGTDTQAVKSTGVEINTVANLTSSWTLVWNFATNQLESSDLYPVVKEYKAAALANSRATPQTDAFLNTLAPGTPLSGYTKYRSNLVTRYRFQEGRLKGLYFGLGAQYRGKTYIGRATLPGATIADLYADGYTVCNLIGGYQTTLFSRRTTFAGNIDNLFDRQAYRTNSALTGAWVEGTNFKFTIRVDL